MKKLMFIVAVTAGFAGNSFALDKAMESLKAAVPPSSAGNIAVPAAVGIEILSADKSVSDPTAEVKKAVRAAQIPEVKKYGRNFWYGTFPKEADLKAILAEATGEQESGIYLKDFDMYSGNKAAVVFAKILRSEATVQEEDIDEKVSPGLFRAIADAAEKAFTDEQYFAKVRLASRDIKEDGDLQSATLVGYRQDGSLFVVFFTNWPF